MRDRRSQDTEASRRCTPAAGDEPSTAVRRGTKPQDVPRGSTGIACTRIVVSADWLERASELRGMSEVSSTPHSKSTISATSQTGRVAKGMNVLTHSKRRTTRGLPIERRKARNFAPSVFPEARPIRH